MDVLYRYIKCASPWWTISTQFTLCVVPHQGCEGQTGRYRSSQDGQCHSHWLWQLTAVLWQRRQLDHEQLTAISSYLSNVSKAIIQPVCRNPAPVPLKKFTMLLHLQFSDTCIQAIWKRKLTLMVLATSSSMLNRCWFQILEICMDLQSNTNISVGREKPRAILLQEESLVFQTLQDLN